MLQRLNSALFEMRAASRLRTWPTGKAWRIAAFASEADAEHLRLFLDAARTFHPGSSVELFAADPGSVVIAAEPGAVGDEFSAAIKPLSEAGAKRYDMAALLHPWPWTRAESAARLAPARRAFARCRAPRKWIHFRNLEIWDGALAARLRRRAIDLALRPLSALAERRERDALDRRVLPRLPGALRWSGEKPCPHARAERIFSAPRAVYFCPDCGMGLTPSAEARSEEENAKAYGEGFAQSFRYVGGEERRRYVEANIRRVRGYLETMGFDPNALPSETRRALDYGCGSGRYAELWTNFGWRYLGVDPSEENVRFAREHAAQIAGVAPGQIEFVRGGLDCAEIKSGAPFGAIFLSHVIEHVPDPVGLLAGLRAVAAPGAWLYLECPDAERYAWSAAHRGYANPHHIWDFTPAMLAAIVRSAGWTDIRQTRDPDAERFPHQALLARAPG